MKPANIKVTPEGKIKVLDFGLAKAFAGDGADVNLSQSPTLSMKATQQGVILGTAAYMSPEQARGRAVDKRADVWAFGCVLFEMLTGRRTYEGPTASDVLAGVLAREPDWKSLPPNVHPRIRLLLERCLEKEAKDRRHDIADARVDIQKVLADPGFRHGTADGTGVLAGVGRWNRLSVALAALAALLAGTLGWSLLRPMERPVSRYSIALPVTQRANVPGSSVAVSPDGTQMVYVGQGEQGQQLWLRRRDQLQATPIRGTEGAANPVFSPDGQRVAFHEGTPAATQAGGGGVSAVSLSGGPPLAIVESGVGLAGLAWGPDGYVYFEAIRSALLRVPETSGEVEPFTVLDTAQSEAGHIWPQALPNGRGVLFTVDYLPNPTNISQYDIAVADLETGEHEVLLRGVFARYAASGHLVYVTADGTLLAAPFDQDALQLAGDPVALTEGVGVRVVGSVHLALSDDGTLVYQAGGGSEFVWVTRSGQATPVDRGWSFVRNFGFRLSPDGTRIAFDTVVEGNHDIWIKHLPDGPRERITFYEHEDFSAFWTPDGQTVTYFSQGPLGDRNVKSKRANGIGEAVLVLDEERDFDGGSWSPDGQWLLLRTAAAPNLVGQRDILTFHPGVDSAAIPLVATPEFDERAPALSPDGRWLAYISNETGSYEVFVVPFPNVDSTRVRVSRDGGLGTLWAHSGRELFFVDQDRGLVAAQFDPASGQVLAQETLFTIPVGYVVAAGLDFYDITSDDQRFLMVRPYEGEGEAAATEVIVVENFFEELKERVPVP